MDTTINATLNLDSSSLDDAIAKAERLVKLNKQTSNPSEDYESRIKELERQVKELTTPAVSMRYGRIESWQKTARMIDEMGGQQLRLTRSATSTNAELLLQGLDNEFNILLAASKSTQTDRLPVLAKTMCEIAETIIRVRHSGAIK